MAATAQLYLGLYVRVFRPLAKLGPLRALTASARALSETLGFIGAFRCRGLIFIDLFLEGLGFLWASTLVL